ncbi:hypothetical protein [Methanocella conradii]|nr:hypothetical protein [Methanocella conradii]
MLSKRIRNKSVRLVIILLLAVVLAILMPVIRPLLRELYFSFDISWIHASTLTIMDFIMVTMISLGAITILPIIEDYIKVRKKEVVVFISSVIVIGFLYIAGWAMVMSHTPNPIPKFPGIGMLSEAMNTIILYAFITIAFSMFYAIILPITFLIQKIRIKS